MLSRRHLLVSAAAAGLMPLGLARAADKPTEIRIDWATYNPVSMVLKDKGLLEKEFAKDGIGIRWVQTLGSNKALEFLNAGSIDFGSTAGSAALLGRINGNPIKSIYVYLASGMDRAGDAQGYADQQDRGSQGQARRGDPRHRSAHLPGARAAVGRHERKGHPAGAAAASRRQDRADSRRRRRLGRSRSDDGAAQVEDGARLFYRNKAANTWGILNSSEEFLKNYPDLTKRVLAVYEEARKYCLANYDDEKRVFMDVTKLPGAVVDIQLKERTELTFNRIGPEQRDTILQAGLALQQAGVIPANVDVKKTLDDLVDDRYVAALSRASRPATALHLRRAPCLL